jgi:hypothetical protein
LGRRGLTRAGRRRWASLAAAGLLGLLAGCGSRTPTPQLIRPAASGGFQVSRYAKIGFSLAVPQNWTTVAAYPPLVAVRTSDRAVIALWRYPSRTQPPHTAAQLREAGRRLVAAARGRDHTLRLINSSTGSVAGYPAIELRTVQRINQQVREVSSTHLFGPGEELVLEEYAPVRLFAGLDRSVFSAVRRSLTALRH